MSLWREHRGEALILVVTAVAIVAVNMFEGVLIGLALPVAKTAWEASHLKLEVVDKGAGPHPGVPVGQRDLPAAAEDPRQPGGAAPGPARSSWTCSGLHHLDHACRTALENWAERHSAAGTEPVRVTDARSR